MPKRRRRRNGHRRHRTIRLGSLLFAVCACPFVQAAGQTVQAPLKPARPIVIELVVTAADTVPVRLPDDRLPPNPYPGDLEHGALVLHREAAKQIRWGRPGRAVFFPKAVKTFADAKYAFIERVSYAGAARTGTFTRIFLTRAFPPFPIFRPPKQVRFGPLASRTRLMRTIPWPKAKWRLTGNNRLEIAVDDDTHVVEPGGKHEFKERAVELPLLLVRHKPAAAGAPAAAAMRQEIAAGIGRFVARVIVVFHGPTAIEVGK